MFSYILPKNKKTSDLKKASAETLSIKKMIKLLCLRKLLIFVNLVVSIYVYVYFCIIRCVNLPVIIDRIGIQMAQSFTFSTIYLCVIIYIFQSYKLCIKLKLLSENMCLHIFQFGPEMFRGNTNFIFNLKKLLVKMLRQFLTVVFKKMAAIKQS